MAGSERDPVCVRTPAPPCLDTAARVGSLGDTGGLPGTEPARVSNEALQRPVFCAKRSTVATLVTAGGGAAAIRRVRRDRRQALLPLCPEDCPNVLSGVSHRTHVPDGEFRAAPDPLP